MRQPFSFGRAIAALGVLLLLPFGSDAAAKLRVVASINDLGSIAATVGGEQVEVLSIARGNADPHRVEVLPSYMVRVSKAQLYLKVGMQLDQWADSIIDGSRNGKLRIVDCSERIVALEVPKGRVDGRQGDVHPDGNPHYWLDPRNGAIVAAQVAEALAALDPAHAEFFAANAAQLAGEAETFAHEQAERIAALPVRTVLTYHRSWVYLAQVFGLEIVATVEPVPGIPPTAKHLQSLVQVLGERGVRVLLQEPYFSQEAGKFLAREADVTPITFSPSCDSTEPGEYLAHLRAVLDAVVAANGA
jgi:zinc/manganese transport system substrate-binding protein